MRTFSCICLWIVIFSLTLEKCLGVAGGGDRDVKGSNNAKNRIKQEAKSNVNASPNAHSNRTTTKLLTMAPTTTTVTTPASSTTNRWYPYDLPSVGILGCKWPSDLIERVDFCVKQQNLTSAFKSANANDITFYGILSPKVVEPLLSNCAHHSNSCQFEMSQQEVTKVFKLWRSNEALLKAFRVCLQKNTEGMARMCGVETKVSSVISGIIGLHINIMDLVLNIVTSKEVRLNEYNSCLKKVAEILHETVAFYLISHFYVRNSVLCWDVTQGTCVEECQKFAESLACLEKRCDWTRLNIKKTAIWEWYIKDPVKAKQTCNISSDDDICSHTATDITDKKNIGFKKLLNGIEKKWKEFKDTVENDLHIPIPLALATTLSVFIIFTLGVALICMWRQGLLGSERKDLRYTKMTPNRKARYSEEKQALTLDDQDEV